MLLDASLLNTQRYKVRIKGKVEQPRETSSAIPYTEKGAFGSPSTMVANFYWFKVLLFNISNSINQIFLFNINNLYTTVWFRLTNNNNP